MTPGAQPPSGALFRLTVQGRSEALEVASFRAREQVSALYRMDVQIATTDLSGDAGAALLGQRVALVAWDESGPVRAIHGVVFRVESQGVFRDDKSGFLLTVSPAMARLQRRRTRRIFQHRTTLDIAAQLLSEHGVRFRMAARSAPPRRDYAVQYDETDQTFLTRLFAEDGLFYFFEHPLSFTESASEVVVIAGRAEEYLPIHGEPVLHYERWAGDGAMLAAEDRVGWFVGKDRVKSRHTRVRAHDFRRPDTDLRDEATFGGGAPKEVSAPQDVPPRGVSTPQDVSVMYEHAGGFEDDPGARPAHLRLEQERRKARTAEGKSACRRLLPGHSFTLDGHDVRFLNRAWTVTRIHHRGYSPGAAPAGAPLYTNRFVCIPSDVPARPRFVPTKPRQVAETAVVVGPSGHDIHTDEYGRIRVQFHWDLEGRRDDKSSCYLRVAQAWADAGYGAQFIPRVGSEVVVTYLGGDVDKPLVTGCVYNATHPQPFKPPEDATRSGIRTRSTPFGHGFNEISFQDAMGSEEVFLHAERNYREVVRNERTSRVDGDSSRDVSGDAREFVAKNASLRVGLDRTSSVGGNEAHTVSGRSEATIAGDMSVEVKGARAVTVHGMGMTEVRGGHTMVVGTGGAPAPSDTFVHGPLSIASADQVTVRADTSLRLQVGESFIEVTRDKIVLRSKTVEVTATDTLECGTKNGPSMTLGSDIEILSSKLRVFTESGALELDKEFKANGAKIKLGYSPDKPSHDKDEKEPETKPFACKLSDYFLKPFAEKKYHVLAGGLRFEGTTDGDGSLEAQIPKSARQVTVRLWLDRYPEGRQRLFHFKISAEPFKPGVFGAKQRLHNLGYDPGPLSSHANEDFKRALAEFQQDHHDSHALEPTGELDEGTQGALEEVHGH